MSVDFPPSVRTLVPPRPSRIALFRMQPCRADSRLDTALRRRTPLEMVTFGAGQTGSSGDECNRAESVSSTVAGGFLRSARVPDNVSTFARAYQALAWDGTAAQ